MGGVGNVSNFYLYHADTFLCLWAEQNFLKWGLGLPTTLSESRIFANRNEVVMGVELFFWRNNFFPQ